MCVENRQDEKRHSEMNSSRKTAIIAGALFITATAADLLSSPFLAPVNASNYLVSAFCKPKPSNNRRPLLFIGAAAAASIAISLYPSTKKIQ